MNASQAHVLPPKQGKALNVVSWVLQVLAAAAFIGAALGKLSGSPQMIQVFETIGLGQWFRYLTGALEVIGAIALLVPRTVFYGAVLLACVMVGAVVTHLAVIGGSPAPAVILLLLVGVIAWIRRPARF